jgi:hypothetical protein
MVIGWFSDGTASAQGVKQVWPWMVRTSAPGGSDSKRSVCSCGPDELEENQSGMDGMDGDGIQSGMAEHPASPTPITTAVAAATTSPTRDMTLSVPNAGP